MDAKASFSFLFYLIFILFLVLKKSKMAKQKNTDNKKLHSKLMDQKKNKKQLQKEKNQLRLRELNKLAGQILNQKTED